MQAAACATILSFLFLIHGCFGQTPPVQLKYKAVGASPEVIAVYEGWFGETRHIAVGYSSHDEKEIRSQIHKAKAMGISAFVMDWYGDRDAYVDQTYALMQAAAEKDKFHVAMMYEESNQEDGATDEAIADFTMFHDTYLTSKAKGHQAYLTYEGRPIIFVFPNGNHTDWAKVRAVVNKWDTPPFLIQENLPGPHPDAFDGFYPWINPGPLGWAPNGSNWGERYLADFYTTMAAKYADKIIVGGAWAQLDDSKASWGLSRHISAQCGQTYEKTFNYWKQFLPAGQVIPFMMIETWNDYEEGSDVEPGLPTCPAAQTANKGAPNGAYATAPSPPAR
jgi:hypothetical protein